MKTHASYWLMGLMIVSASPSAQDTELVTPAVALDATDGIIEAFRSHSVVAMGEGVGHGNEQGHAFLRALIRDPRFASVADDIVVEWGNSLYQDVIDRFTRGEDVPYSELRKVWEKTTQPHPVWDSQVYGEFFQAVRSQNETLPEEEDIRVLLGDPPIDWESVNVRKDLARLFWERDAYPAGLVQAQVIEKGRRALVVYGGMHLMRLPREQNTLIGEDSIRVEDAQLRRLRAQYGSETLVTLLERQGTEVFNVWGVPADVAAKVQPEVGAWSPIRLTLIENTTLGAATFQRYFPGGDTAPMQEQFDALMIFGPLSAMTWSPLSPELCRDDEYVEMRVSRMGYDDRQAFIRQYCGQNSTD